MTFFIVAFLISFTVGPISGRLWRYGLQRLWGSNAGPDVLTVDDRGITVEGSMGLTHVPWGLIDGIVECDGYMYFAYRRIASLYVPISGFETRGEFEDFKAEVSAYHANVQANSSSSGRAEARRSTKR
jgi:hypothetical protein